MKKLEDIPKPDPRVGLMQNPTLEVLYKSALSWSLVERVPKNIRDIWEVAQYQFVYSYYCYEFVPVAELYCHFSFELALREIVKRQTGKMPESYKSAIGQLDKFIPGIKKNQKFWLQNHGKMRNLSAHPTNRRLDFWGDYRMREMARFINGLFFFENPHLLFSSRLLYNPNDLHLLFSEPGTKNFPFSVVGCIHSSRGVELIKKCKNEKVTIAQIEVGVEEPGVIKWGLPHIDLKNLVGDAFETWEEFRVAREKMAIKEIEDLPKVDNLFLKFSFIHEEEWYAVKMEKETTNK